MTEHLKANVSIGGWSITLSFTRQLGEPPIDKNLVNQTVYQIFPNLPVRIYWPMLENAKEFHNA